MRRSSGQTDGQTSMNVPTVVVSSPPTSISSPPTSVLTATTSVWSPPVVTRRVRRFALFRAGRRRERRPRER
eukprot:5187386-Pleurochrysis_carterae.AAC.2